MPGSPRCRICGAPFGGAGSRLVAPLGYRPSRKNPHVCATCIEFAPPGGTAMDVGVLFADVRGFTSLSESMEPGELSSLLRRLYSLAEEVLFPEALIDKLFGDQVPGRRLRIELKGKREPVVAYRASADTFL